MSFAFFQEQCQQPPEVIGNPDQTEAKENISPENTVNSIKSVDTPAAALPSPPPSAPPKLEKVIFELGDDEEDDEPAASTVVEPPLQSSVTAAIQQAAGNDPIKLRDVGSGGLGQLARDSLSILKGGASQDSMRSLDSLPEFELASQPSSLLLPPPSCVESEGDDEVFACEPVPNDEETVSSTIKSTSEAVSTEMVLEQSTTIES